MESKNTLTSKYTWRIENFSHLNAKNLYSATFVVNENKWSLLLYPKGNNTDHLSVYLNVADSSSLPDNWSITTMYSIALINQIDSKKTIKKDTVHTFNYLETDWGFTSFVPLGKFLDKMGGYLVEDTCLIEAELYVNGVSPAPTNEDLDSSADLDPVESVYAHAQSFLKSLPKKPSTPVSEDATSEVPVLKDLATSAKECFGKLISYQLDDLDDPKHETAMMESISILTNSLSLFSDGQAKEIVNLKDTFPQIMQEWRDSTQVKGSSERLCSTFEKTKSLLEDLVKTDDELKTKLDELNRKEKELEAQLEAIRNRSRQLKEERAEVSKQTKKVCSLAKDQASKIEAKEVEVDCANKKMEDLKAKWHATQHLFA